MNSLFISLYLALGVSLTLLADIALKQSGLLNLKWLMMGLFLYGLAAIPVALLFRLVPFGNLFIIWEAAYLILGITVGAGLYGEAFTAYRLCAVLLALGALFLSYK